MTPATHQPTWRERWPRPSPPGHDEDDDDDAPIWPRRAYRIDAHLDRPTSGLEVYTFPDAPCSTFPWPAQPMIVSFLNGTCGGVCTKRDRVTPTLFFILSHSSVPALSGVASILSRHFLIFGYVRCYDWIWAHTREGTGSSLTGREQERVVAKDTGRGRRRTGGRDVGRWCRVTF